MKKCSKCEIEKNLTDYYKNKRMRDGLDNLCKSCRKHYNSKDYTPQHKPRPFKWNGSPLTPKPCAYKVTTPEGEVYYGSTIQYFPNRLNEHRQKNDTRLGHLIQDLGTADLTIELFMCETEEEARSTEKILISENKCVNFTRL